MATNTGGGRRIGALKGPRRLSVVLRPSRRIRDGEYVTIRLGSGRVIEGIARRLPDENSIRIELPEGVS